MTQINKWSPHFSFSQENAFDRLIPGRDCLEGSFELVDATNDDIEPIKF